MDRRTQELFRRACQTRASRSASLDKTKMTVLRSIQMDYSRRSDLCLNPVKPVSYVTVDKVSHDGVVHQILAVDELTGDVREPDDFLGTYVKVTPNGRVLYSAYRDIYKKGERLLINPDWIGTVPVYGNIDILIVYDISGRSPREIAVKDEPGGNGQGLAMSPDGRKICYLSFVGYPLYSNNIAIWDLADLTKRPSTGLAAKDNKADLQAPFVPPRCFQSPLPPLRAGACMLRC